MLPSLIKKISENIFYQSSPIDQIINKFRNQQFIESQQPLDIEFTISKNSLQIKQSNEQTAQNEVFKSLGVFEPKLSNDQRQQLKQLENDQTNLKFTFDNKTGLMKLGEYCEINKYNFLSINSESKKQKPIAIDFFFNSNKLYGFPMHCTNLVIPDSYQCKFPFCLDNYDKAAYAKSELQTLGLYGSMPILIIPCLDNFIGLVWKNASRTWMDVRRNEEGMELLLISEEGDLDFEIFIYENIQKIFLKLGEIQGFTAMPRYFGLGYQHCRWSFDDEQDVRQVNQGFNDNDIPYDIIYLDIDHTDQMKYFTFDEKKYPNIDEMINTLENDGRKLVTIVDPHIKVDPEYYVYKEAQKKDLFVKTNKMKDFVGECWPGDSSWIDFLNEEARKFWADQFLIENYKHTNDNVYIWNDMNEPAIFGQTKNAFPPGCLQKLISTNPTTNEKAIKWIPHELIHNLYGQSMTQSTYQGLIQRSQGKLRPFILSRSFFCGSQQYAAFWTGDTNAAWKDFKAQVPILLTMALCGHNFTGCDIGGFFGNPSKELLVRWYQFGALIPFFRGHQHHKAKRREPWLYPKETLNLIKNSIKLRYELLPYLYTQMFISHITNFPFLCPLWAQFPNEEANFYVENEFMVGNSLLFYPIVDPIAKLPEYIFININNANVEYYDYFSLNLIETQQMPQLHKMHLYIQGGKIIPLFKTDDQKFKSSEDLRKKGNYKLVIALNKNNEAEGEFYLDDGDTFNFENQVYVYKSIKYSNGKITIKDKYDNKSNANTLNLPCQLIEIVICGINSETNFQKLTQQIGKNTLKVYDLQINLSENQEINLLKNDKS